MMMERRLAAGSERAIVHSGSNTPTGLLVGPTATCSGEAEKEKLRSSWFACRSQHSLNFGDGCELVSIFDCQSTGSFHLDLGRVNSRSEDIHELIMRLCLLA